MRVAIGFFGITRSLKYTIGSINKNIFDVFNTNNIDYDVFMHTYYLDSYANKRTGEKYENIDNNEYKLLNADYLEIDNQDEIKTQLDLKKYRTHPDPWKTNYNSVDNYILACYSKFQLTKMIEKTKNDYDYILFMRPDCLYTYVLQLKFLKQATDSNIVIPNFSGWGKYCLNDRFAITNMKTYKIYGEAFTKLLELSKIQPLQSETILGEIIIHHKLKFSKIGNFKFHRVRNNGKLSRDYKDKRIKNKGTLIEDYIDYI